MVSYRPATYFRGGTAVVTGAVSGIGRATACAFARDGCEQPLLGDLNVERLQETRDMIIAKHPDATIEISQLDIAQEAEVDAFYNKCVAKFGCIDPAANVACIAQRFQSTDTVTGQQYDKLYGVNQRGTFFCQRAQLRQMLKQEPLPGFESRGSIVNVTSLCGTVPLCGVAVYSASKGAVIGMTKVDALDYGPQKIRINSVAPGNTMTPMVAPVMGDQDHPRFARPEDGLAEERAAGRFGKRYLLAQLTTGNLHHWT